MKILHVINNLRREGAQKLLIDIVTNDLNDNNQIDILLFEDKNDFLEILNKKGIKIIASRTKKYSLKNLIILYRMISQNNYQVVHSHLFPANYFCALILPFFKDIIKITTEHSTNNRRRNKFIFKLIESFLYKSYDKIVGISDAASAKLKSFLFFNHNIITINNGIDFTKILSKENEESIELDLIKRLKNENCFILIMVARFTSVKNHNIVIEAIKSLDKNFHLVLIGGGETYNQIFQKVKSYNLDSRVHFLGVQKNVFQFLKQGDISIIPSLWEGFGLVAVESMACGIPTIVSDIDGLSNIVENGALKFNVNDSNDLVEKILLLKNTNLLKKDLIKDGLRVSNKYNITNTIKEYNSIYNN